jgi:hypothetical protein
MDGEEQRYIKPVTPRRGGDSIMGEHDRMDADSVDFVNAG